MGHLSGHYITTIAALLQKFKAFRGCYMVKGQSIDLIKTCSSSFVATKVKNKVAHFDGQVAHYRL